MQNSVISPILQERLRQMQTQSPAPVAAQAVQTPVQAPQAQQAYTLPFVSPALRAALLAQNIQIGQPTPVTPVTQPVNTTQGLYKNNLKILKKTLDFNIMSGFIIAVTNIFGVNSWRLLC